MFPVSALKVFSHQVLGIFSQRIITNKCEQSKPVVSLQMTEQRKRRQRMGFVDVQAGASGGLPPSAAGGNHQIYKT